MEYTNLEQSKELMELGLKPETADLVWCIVESGDFELRLKDYTITKDTFSFRNGLSVPAWSTDVLLKEIPKTIVVNGMSFEFHLTYREGMWGAKYISEDYYCVMSRHYWASLVNMLTDIMKWLLENKYKTYSHD